MDMKTHLFSLGNIWMSRLNTPIGAMVAVGNDQAVLFLCFTDDKAWHHKTRVLDAQLDAGGLLVRALADIDKVEARFMGRPLEICTHEKTRAIFWLDKGTQYDSVKTDSLMHQLTHEMAAYFSGGLKRFSMPVVLGGTAFQRQVWQALSQVVYGSTQSYADLSYVIQRPTAWRAVARANAANLLSVLVPCHRIICSDGRIGGYSAGCQRKKWLLTHESIHPIALDGIN